MQQFIAGFVVALFVTAVVVYILFRKSSVACFGTKRKHSSADSYRQLEELSKLTGGLAHEIKNPLSTIKINLKLTAEDLQQAVKFAKQSQNNTETVSRALRKISVIQKETDRIEQILEGFLRYVGKTELHPAEVNINELVSDMIDFYSPQAHSHSVIIRLGACRETLICKADADMLKQVMLNLFINAQQAMPQGGELMIRTEKLGNFAQILVSDTGTGIEPEKLPKIFDAYFSSRPRGSGLGLPTAKKIIQAHHGTIGVTSEPNKGTSFLIKLPLHKA
ncbi:MAG: sensor histidine kinase [Planctomycetota bacterium]